MNNSTDTSTVTEFLDSIDGVGPAKQVAVAEAYSSLEDLGAATLEDLCGLDGIGKALARKILHAATTIDDPTAVESFRHDDKRANIPSDEHAHLIDVTGDGEIDTALYPRDPDLDPQLVWRGKDDLDAEPLAVPIVPIYTRKRSTPEC